MAITDKLTAIANAIRAKTGESGTMTMAEMPGKIASIETGGEHGYKSWTVTLPTAVTSGRVEFVESDSDVAAHYADDNATARFTWKGGDATTLPQNNIPSSINGNNLLFPTAYGFFGIRGSASGNINTVANGTALKSALSRTGILAASSEGNIAFTTYSTRILPAGNYTIEFWW